eukprot:17153-Heterococcus_DN1.PRE.7
MCQVLERTTIRFKAQCSSIISAAATAFSCFYNQARALSQTGLLSAGLLAPLKAHMGKLDFSIAVGQTHTHSDSTGVNAYIELHKKLTSKQIEPLPKGTGLAVVIDMSTRDNMSMSELSRHGVFQDITGKQVQFAVQARHMKA